jgi:hypothetical protein
MIQISNGHTGETAPHGRLHTERLNVALRQTTCPTHGRQTQVMPLDKHGWRLDQCCCTDLLKAASEVIVRLERKS